MAHAPQAEYDPVVEHASYRSPYERWKEAEGLPSVHGYSVQNLYDLELAPWESRGGSAAFINLEGTGGLKDAYLYELEPGQSSVPVKHVYDKTAATGSSTSMKIQRFIATSRPYWRRWG